MDGAGEGSYVGTSLGLLEGDEDSLVNRLGGGDGGGYITIDRKDIHMHENNLKESTTIMISDRNTYRRLLCWQGRWGQLCTIDKSSMVLTS